MKDAADNKTPDMIGAPAKRGRPSTGAAKSAAQRKREQRFRDRLNLSRAFGSPAKMADMPTTSLCEMLQSYVTAGHAILAGDIMKELARRAQENDKSKDPVSVTVTIKFI